MPNGCILEKCSVLNVQSQTAKKQLLLGVYANRTMTAKEDTRTYGQDLLRINAKIAR
jgi:hypothetical protein